MKSKLLFVLILSGICFISRAQTIDLSELNTRSQKHHVAPNSTFFVDISNLMLEGNYQIEIRKEIISISNFPNPFDTTEKSQIESPDFCTSFRKQAVSLYKVKDEAELAKGIKEVKTYMEKNNEAALNEPSTKDCWPILKDSVAEIINKTHRRFGPYTLMRGEELVVHISRGEGDEKIEWNYIYSAGSRGEWQISYGFTFITQVWNPEEIFYTAEDGNGSYLLKKEAKRNKLIFSPTLFFTWMPAKRLNKNLSFGASGGLGYDFSKPTVFLGPTLSFNQNLKLHIGAVAHEQKVLNGQYSEGQTLTQILSESQLHKDQYRINFYFSLSFRFDENPFNRK